MIEQNRDLEKLRDTASKTLIVLLWLHLPVAAAIGIAHGADVVLPTVFAAVLAGIATASWRLSRNGLSTRLVVAVAVMSGVSLFTYQFAGRTWQVDIHMYFFASLALLVAYCDYRPVIAGTVAVALHHLVLNFVIPAAIFPGGGDFGRVVLHAVVLLLEAGTLVWIAHQLEQLFLVSARKTAEVETAVAAEAAARLENTLAEQRLKAEADAAMSALAEDFESKIGYIVASVAVASHQMQGMSSSMSSNSADAARQTAAAEAASTQASRNVSTVASAAEELATSISEIARQASRSAQVAGKATDDAARATDVIAGLALGTGKIGEVLTLIHSIASQTNLLALNATIEAARAGEHGRGFAIVASEVKALAIQTAKATEDISLQIESIRSATGEAVSAIQTIGGTIAEISGISNAIASAVQQQGAATSEIAGAVQQAAAGTGDANANIVGVARTANEAGIAASQLLAAANGLSAQSERLKTEVGSFLGSVRAA
jgi:methyl-accepting chemotaxis protein